MRIEICRQDHPAGARLGSEDFESERDQVVEIDDLRIVVIVSQQITQVRDDLSGALIGFAYVRENGTNQNQVRWILREQNFRSFGIAEDSPQRLVQLMRNGGRNRAQPGTAVQAHDLRQMPARLQFSGMPPAALKQESGNDRRLQ